MKMFGIFRRNECVWLAARSVRSEDFGEAAGVESGQSNGDLLNFGLYIRLRLFLFALYSEDAF